MIDLDYFGFACANFAIFALFLIVIRIGHFPNPQRLMNRFHLRFFLLYLAFSVYHSFTQGTFDFASWFVGFYIYFGLQYGIFMHVFGVAMRSFSLNICVTIFQKGSKTSLTELFQSFGNAKGTEFIKQDRMKVMESAKTIHREKDLFALSPRGEFVVKLNRLILNLWGLSFLGKK